MTQIQLAQKLGYSPQWIQANEQQGPGQIKPGLERTLKQKWQEVVK